MKNLKKVMLLVLAAIILFSGTVFAELEVSVASPSEVPTIISQAIRDFESSLVINYDPTIHNEILAIVANYHKTTYDHNDYEKFLGNYKYTYGYYKETGTASGKMYIDIQPIHTRGEESYMKDIISQNIQDMKLRGVSDIEKVRRVHDRIVLETTYDASTEIVDGKEIAIYNSPVDIIKQGRGLCQSYAMLFYNYMLDLGIPVRIVSGDAEGIPHAWNMVKINGNWYNVDSTYDDPVLKGGNAGFENLVSYENFLVPNSDISITHTADAGYPIATEPAANTGLGENNPRVGSVYYNGYGKIYTEEEKLALFNGEGLPDVPVEQDPPVDPDPPESDSEIIQEIIETFGLVNPEIWSKKTATTDRYSWTVRFNKPIATSGYEWADIYNKIFLSWDDAGLPNNIINTTLEPLDGGRAIRISILPESDSYIIGKTYFVVVKQGVLAQDGSRLNRPIIMPFVFNGY